MIPIYGYAPQPLIHTTPPQKNKQTNKQTKIKLQTNQNNNKKKISSSFDNSFIFLGHFPSNLSFSYSNVTTCNSNAAFLEGVTLSFVKLTIVDFKKINWTRKQAWEQSIRKINAFEYFLYQCLAQVEKHWVSLVTVWHIDRRRCFTLKRLLVWCRVYSRRTQIQKTICLALLPLTGRSDVKVMCAPL